MDVAFQFVPCGTFYLKMLMYTAKYYIDILLILLFIYKNETTL